MFEIAQASILLLDDDIELLSALKRLLRPLRQPLLVTTQVDDAEAFLRQHEIAVIICEPRDPRTSQFLIDSQKHYPSTVRLVLTGYPDLNSVLRAVNQANPLKLLVKPWLNEELVDTVKLALSQYTLNRQRDSLIEEYMDVRDNAERSHAFNVLNALIHSIHNDMTAAAIHQLPVCALLCKDGVVQSGNALANQFLHDVHDVFNKATKNQPWLTQSELLQEALIAPRRKRQQKRISENEILAYVVFDLMIGTLIIFTLEPVVGHPLAP
jgi:FixJ family two-component response regulator